MSQRKEKYARSMERRTAALEGAVAGQKEQIAMLEKNQMEQCIGRVVDSACVGKAEEKTNKRIRRQRWEIERTMARQRVGLLIALVLAVAALIVAPKDAGPKQAEAPQPTVIITAKADADILTAGPVEDASGEFAALRWEAEDSPETEPVSMVSTWAGE